MSFPYRYNLSIATEIHYSYFRVKENTIRVQVKDLQLKRICLRGPKGELQGRLKPLFLFRLWETKEKSLGSQ